MLRVGGKPRNRGSHTARSGQEPHTPGGTKSVLRVGGKPRKTAGLTLRGAAMAPYTPGGTKSVLRVGGKPRKTAGPTLRGAAIAPYTPGGTQSVRVGGEPEKTAGPTLRGAAMAPHTPGGTINGCCVQPEKVVLGVLAKMGLIRAEQLAGPMPSTSLSTRVLGCLKNRSFRDCDGMPRFHPHEQVF